MIGLNGNDSYNSGSGGNNCSYNNSGGYNNNYSSNNYKSSDFAQNKCSGKNVFLIMILMGLLLFAVFYGADLIKVKNCKAETKGTVIDVTEIKRANTRRDGTVSSYRYKYKAKIAYAVDDEMLILDVPKSSQKFCKGQTEAIHYNESKPSESYSDRYIEQRKADFIFTIIKAVLYVVAAIMISIIFSTSRP